MCACTGTYTHFCVHRFAILHCEVFLFPQRPRSPSQLQLMPVTSIIIKDKQRKNEVSQGMVYDGNGWMGDQPATWSTASPWHWLWGG